jgi:hypothetical protein
VLVVAHVDIGERCLADAPLFGVDVLRIRADRL